VIAFLHANFPRYCPFIVHANGFHRYKPRFLVYILFIDDYKFVATGLLLTHPDYVKVPNSAVDMNSWAELACYPRGSFYPLIFDRI